MHNLAIKCCASPPILDPRFKIFDVVGYKTSDLLKQRQTCYSSSSQSRSLIVTFLCLPDGMGGLAVPMVAGGNWVRGEHAITK